jgi:DnaD/phage-associated family protein
MRLLRLEFDENKELTGICFLDAASIMSPQTSMVPMQAAPEKEVPKIPPRENYSAAQLRELQEESDIQELLFVAEHYLGHPLNATEMNAILYWKEGLHFSADLIDYLIESCVAKNHRSVRYMEKIALSWAKANISTVEDAKEEAKSHNELHSAIKKAFGIVGRDFVPFENAFIDTWQKEYGFSADIIANACERTIRAINNVSFEYADSILKSWKNSNVTSLQDIQALDVLHQEKNAKHTENHGTTQKKPRYADFPQRSYDMNQLEKELLNYGTN